MEEHSLLAVTSPHPDYQVFLQPELSSFTPEHSVFRAADWIYSHEKRRSLPEDHVREASPSPARTTHKRMRLPAQYLVNRQEKDDRGRLRQALWQNPLAFYYYKQRHLFKPYSRSHRPNATAAEPKARPHTTAQHTRTRTAQICRPQTSPVEAKARPLASGDQFLTTLLEKCEQVPATRPVTRRTLRERETLKEFHKRFDWTQRTLSQISDCEADLIIPFYLNQREAFEDLHRDAQKSNEEYRKAVTVPGIGVAKFERVLRRNKNQIL